MAWTSCICSDDNDARVILDQHAVHFGAEPRKWGQNKEQESQMSPEAQIDIKMHCYDFYQINLYSLNKFQIYFISGDCKRNVNYDTINHNDLER
jgi:hypothetical protein